MLSFECASIHEAFMHCSDGNVAWRLMPLQKGATELLMLGNVWGLVILVCYVLLKSC